ncbi:C-type lectin domain 17 member A [Mactra antiquata]
MLFFLFCISLLSWTTESATTCPDQWIPYHESCYLFGHTHLSFFEAGYYCQQHNSHLVRMETATENNFIKNHIRYMTEARWWIGLTDVYAEHQWVWYGTNEPPVFTDWYPGQPDDQGYEEDCCELLYRHGQWAWHDVDCNYHISYAICEMDGGIDQGIVG